MSKSKSVLQASRVLIVNSALISTFLISMLWTKEFNLLVFGQIILRIWSPIKKSKSRILIKSDFAFELVFASISLVKT